MIEFNYELPHPPISLSYLIYTNSFGHRITVDRMVQEDGTYKWAVRNHLGNCLSIDCTWEHEPLISWRSDDWLVRCRFSTQQEAIEKARSAAHIMHGDDEERARVINEQLTQRNSS